VIIIKFEGKVNEKATKWYGQKVIRRSRGIHTRITHTYTHTWKGLITMMSIIPCDLRRNSDPAIRSSDIVPRHVSSKRGFARIRWARCALVLIGSTSWIVGWILCEIVASSYFYLFQFQVIFGIRLMNNIPRFPAVKFSQRNTFLNVRAN